MKTAVLCAALPQEIRGLCAILKLIAPSERQKIVGPIEAYRWRLVILTSGVGQANMEKTLQTLPPLERADYWLSVGFAGALVPDVEVGDCLVGSTIKTPRGDILSFDYPENLDDEIEDRCLLCVDEIVTTPQEKRELHKRSGAVAVDMESAAVARHAVRRGEPFLWVRSVSDGLEEGLPPELSQCMDAQGFPSLRAALGLVTAKPSLIPPLFRMGRRTQRLSRDLGLTLASLLSKLE